MSYSALRNIPTVAFLFHPYLMAQGQENAENPAPEDGSDGSTAPRDDLPYKVELWNAERTSVQQILAITANGSIGYAAFYAATREYPDRYVTLRHRNRVLSRWNAQH